MASVRSGCPSLASRVSHSHGQEAAAGALRPRSRATCSNVACSATEKKSGGGHGKPRAAANVLAKRIESLKDGELQRRQKAADLTLLNMGITFNVYGHEAGTEKVWPFDVVPRMADGGEWTRIERGLVQRIRALNLFIDDISAPAGSFGTRSSPNT